MTIKNDKYQIMKQLVLSSLLLLATTKIKAQTTQLRDVKPFQKIEVSGSANVIYSQSDTVSIKVTAAKNEIDAIYTTFENDILVIKAKGNFTHNYTVHISGNTLKQLTSSGATKFNSNNVINADSLTIDVSGASDVNLKVRTQATNMMLSGASRITIEGQTSTLYSTVSGASTLKAYKLNAITTNVTASGASTAKVFAQDKINANATGSSTIKFKGEPKDVNAEASSSSSISKVVSDDLTKNAATDKDSTTFNFRNKKYVIINKDKNYDEDDVKVDADDFKHWNGMSIGVNGWLANGNINMPKKESYMDLNYGKSLNFQFNAFEKNIRLYKNYINLVTGLGIEWNRYEFNNKTKLYADTNYTNGYIDTTSNFGYQKNRLKTSFINVPLLLEFNTNKNPKKSFHLAFGVIGGYKLNSKTIQVVTQNSNTIKITRKDDYNLNPFRVNAHASIGYHNFTVFADYGLTTLFETNKGPNLIPFTIGLKLITF